MTEQKYRAVVRTADGRQMYGTLTGIESAREEITATFTEDRAERPVPATELQKPLDTAIQAPGFAASLPTRDQIADELIEALPPHVSHEISEPHLDAIADAVLGMMTPGEEASKVRSPYHCMSEEGHTAHIWAGSWCPGTETPAPLHKAARR